MAALTTGVVNAGFPTSGAPLQVKRGAMSYFSVVKNVTPTYDNNTLRGTAPQTDFTSTTARKSVTYNNSITFEKLVGTTPYQSVVKNVSFIAETPEVLTVDVKTNPFYLANILTVNSTVNETTEGTVGFYHKISSQTFSTLSIAPVVDNSTNLQNKNNNGIMVNTLNEPDVVVMDNASFDQTLSTRQRVAMNVITEPSIFTLNVTNTSYGQNSPAQVVLNNVSTKIVEQNNNLGRIGSSAIQPKGSEAGNIGFAQAFGNTTITGKWF